MTGLEAVSTLHDNIEGTTARFVFSSAPAAPFSEPRIDILYTYPPVQHAGLLHWIDERNWYADNHFIVALELSKFCRLAMKHHPYAERLLAGQELLGAHAWPPPFDISETVSGWIETCNGWLHALRKLG